MNYYKHVSSWKILCTVLFSLALLIGCGTSGPPRITGSVKITFTYDDKPVTAGIVSMIGDGHGDGSFGQLTADGSLSLPEVVVGKYIVIIEPPLSAVDDTDRNTAPPPKVYDNLPEKFRSEATSTLKVEVVEGENTFTFDLKQLDSE